MSNNMYELYMMIIKPVFIILHHSYKCSQWLIENPGEVNYVDVEETIKMSTSSDEKPFVIYTRTYTENQTKIKNKNKNTKRLKIV